MKKISAHATPNAFTLIEALLLVVILSIVGVGVGIGLQGSTKLPEATDQALALSTELNSEIEAWKAIAWSTTSSTWPSTLPYNHTDTVTINVDGETETYARAVAIQDWDPNNLASNLSPQTNFCQVKVTINGQILLCYITNPN